MRCVLRESAFAPITAPMFGRICIYFMARLAACSVFACMAVKPLPAQTVRATPASIVRPNLNIGGSLLVTATPSSTNFTLAPGSIANASSPITIYTKASNITVFGSISLYGYFSGAAALTSAEGATLASGNVFGYSDAQPSWQPFTGSCPFTPNSCLLIFRTTSILDLGIGAGHQNTLNLRINLTNTPQQPAGNYSGTLTLQAQAL